jgi:capsular exopolysaccharide synthesis family protein
MDAPVDPMAPAGPAIGEPISETFDRIAARYEGKTVLESEVSPQSREQYRRLAASLHHAQALHGTRVIMVTSALVGEGKTLTAANLALTLSQSYQKQVLLVDADLRRPSLQAVFGIRSGSGLMEGLTSHRERSVPVHQVSPKLGILQAGRPTSDPIAALTSERMRRLVDEARKSFDWVILDTPPVALLTDASLMSSMTDGAILVVKASHTSFELVERAVAAVGRERTLGVVLNHAELPIQGSGYYGDYYYYYGGAPK